jgi:uncharacterized phage protein gp47/JayE
MYENQTESNIKQRMLDNVPSDVCKLEGSFIYDAVSPVSTELAAAYMALEIFLQNIFAQTSSGEYLEKKAAEFGVCRKKGTAAKCKVIFTGIDGAYPANIIVQTKTGCQYKTTAELTISSGVGAVDVKAVEIGSKYNVPEQTIIELPMQITGITSIKNLEPAEGGTDVEKDEDLLKRLTTKVQCPSTSGNINHYKLWALETDGIGDVKAFTLPEEPGTIKLIVIDNNKMPVSPEIIVKVKKHIENERPIGANVVVESAVEKLIKVSVKVDLLPGYNEDEIKKLYEHKLDEFRKEVAFKENTISYPKIGSLLFSIPGVKNYDNLTVNGIVENITLQENEVPKIQVDTLLAYKK